MTILFVRCAKYISTRSCKLSYHQTHHYSFALRIEYWSNISMESSRKTKITAMLIWHHSIPKSLKLLQLHATSSTQPRDEDQRPGIAAKDILQDSQRHFLEGEAQRVRTRSQDWLRAERRFGASSATARSSSLWRRCRRHAETADPSWFQRHRREPDDRLGDHWLVPYDQWLSITGVPVEDQHAQVQLVHSAKVFSRSVRRPADGEPAVDTGARNFASWRWRRRAIAILLVHVSN